MSHSETAAYPPPPRAPAPQAPDTHAATMMAPPASAQPTIAANLDATLAADVLPSSQETIAVDGAGPGTGNWTIPPGGTRGYETVLPDVRSEGDNLIIVPRAETRYQSETVLGRGGMGEVKLALDQDIGRKVAVKRLLDERNPHAVARFIDEVRTVGALEHPNIVPIHDVGVDEDGSLFFVMKYVEGETLASIIEQLAAGNREYHQRYSFEVRLDLFVGLLRALQYAHSRGLVHRDIKPENIMVGRYGEVVLMDWGIAHQMRGADAHVTLQSASTPANSSTSGLSRASNETVDGAVIGTPQYMSPEQASGEVAELDGRSDLYSAMVVLYELLTLAPFVEAKSNPMATILAVQESKAPGMTDPNYMNPHQAAVPVEWRHYLLNALANDRANRFQTADEALMMLEQVRSGEFVGCPITFMKANNTKMERFMDRYPGASMLLAATTIVTFLGGVAGWVMWGLS